MHGGSGVAVVPSNVHLSSSSSSIHCSSNKLEVVVDDRGGGGSDDSDKENNDVRKFNGCGGRKLDTENGGRRELERGCRKCLERFENVIRGLDSSLGFFDAKGRDSERRRAGVVGQQQPNKGVDAKRKKQLTPLNISISVVDPDNNNLNVCLCSTGGGDTDQDEVDQMQSGNRICGRCQNIIDQQPLDHRKALISQRLTLAHDIIVNRIDSQFLSTGVAVGKSQYEPYTPDSMESHSPLMLLGLGSRSELQSSASSSSFTDATTATKSSSVSSRMGGEQQDGVEEKVDSVTEGDTNLIERIEVVERGSGEGKAGGGGDGGRPQSLDMATNGCITTSSSSSSGVNAKQLKSRLEKLQILSRMPGHGVNRKSEFGGRIEFENQMRRREEKRELKELRKRGKGLCCYQDGGGSGGEVEGAEKRGSRGQCLVM